MLAWEVTKAHLSPDPTFPPLATTEPQGTLSPQSGVQETKVRYHQTISQGVRVQDVRIGDDRNRSEVGQQSWKRSQGP